MEMVDQETTLMCISNGLDAGLMSNAVWRGIPMADLLQAAAPLAGAERVRLHGVDNYTDTVPFQKAMTPTTLIALKMNGRDLPDRHGFPARAIVPGYFGEKHVKWLTRIEVTNADAKGFYETQGWGPNFIVPTRSRIDVPYNDSWIKIGDAAKGVTVKGVAFGGDRGISRVEFSSDDGESWDEARLDYSGTTLTWVLWSFNWSRTRSTITLWLCVRPMAKVKCRSSRRIARLPRVSLGFTGLLFTFLLSADRLSRLPSVISSEGEGPHDCLLERLRGPSPTARLGMTERIY